MNCPLWSTREGDTRNVTGRWLLTSRSTVEHETIRICLSVKTVGYVAIRQMSKSMINPSVLKAVAGLRNLGFEGFLTVADLRCGNRNGVPAESGVYLVLRSCASSPEFLEVGTGGHFKSKDPNVSIARLKDEWVEGALIVYVGQLGRTLKKRINELIRFGQGSRVGHRGGRLIWQPRGADRLLVCWKEIADDNPKQFEKELIEAFKSAYGDRRPFANLHD